ncbi:unnamed protein product [Durusdinium trenchii]|uniref:Uncharacterized protein n=1 Tax=Durusdinium trenchii TaxID=1381693 RepID=A0ABP0KTE2_9DINO
MHLVSSALLLGLADLVAGAHVEVKRSSFLKPVEFQHQLRLCNAYPGTEVFRVELAGQNLTKSSLAYKECDEAKLEKPLQVGDRLNFIADHLPMGSFTVDSLPGYDAILYIVVQRQEHEAVEAVSESSTGQSTTASGAVDNSTDSVTFQSHLFAMARNAQVAVMDTYVGQAKAALLMSNSTGAETNSTPGYTVMPFGTAFGLAEGNYQVILSDGSAESRLQLPLQAMPGESYVVLRTGAGLAGKGALVQGPKTPGSDGCQDPPLKGS